ncbi:hypothetical protein QBC45DRAFT_200124 [Copromyces sp. CBS 386.78]|nr:hypothetical protein QBC45DRAFT_200124 [Copromyces sp. CBS 386.78]
MSTHQSQPSSPPKRPRLSLQIKTFNESSVRTSRTLAAAVDVKSPTAFNTLSNVYATAVDRSTPIQEHAPATALSGGRPMLRLQTQAGQDGGAAVSKDRRLQTPYLGPYLDTPVTAQPMSPAIATAQSQMMFPSAMTATPPLSAQPQEQNGPRVFTFESSNNNMTQPPSLTLNTTTTTSQASEMPSSCSETPRRRTTFSSNVKLPYTHPRSLRSILRNSPLCQSPNSSRRQSLRLQEKAARRVAYNSPLCETITTSKYTKSHVDLLAEDSGTPTTPTGAAKSMSSSSSSEGSCRSCSSSSEGEELLDQTMAYTGNETRDGGQTPGPYEEMRRRMAGMHASTPISLSPTSGGIRKQRGNAAGRKREKKRRWVWTIGKDAEDAELEECGSPVVPWTARPELSNAVAEKRETAAVAMGVPMLAVPMPPKGRARTRAQTQAQGAGQGQSEVSVAGNKAATAAAAVAATVALQLQIPKLPVPGRPTSRRLRPALSLPCMSLSTPVACTATPLALPSSLVQHQQPQQQQPQQQTQQQQSRATLTPEPTLPSLSQQPQHMVPNTPSMESVTSMTSILSQDSVFDTSSEMYNGDVEMSDASSVYSAGDNESLLGGGEEDVYKNYLQVNGNNFGFNGRVGGTSDQPCHSSDMEMDMDTPTAGGRPGYAVERLGLGIC